MAKQVFILLSVLTGFFLVPGVTYGCGSNPGKEAASCCQERQARGKDEQSCCAGHHSKKSADNDHDKGCSHHFCHCSSVSATVLSYSDSVKHYLLVIPKKEYHLSDFVLSSGFHSIWLPPKIS
jgi:hypothetical protein